jgi:hypothetical protein
MKQRLLSGWNFRRIIYTVVGIAIIVHAIIQREWFSALLGGFFTVMGFFALGCAGGQCSGKSCCNDLHQDR